MTEPQGVAELMARTEAAWRRQIAACEDGTVPEREALREALAGLQAEYGEADYPRREAIGQELQALLARYEALGPAPEAPEMEAEAGAAPHAPVPLGVEVGAAPEAGAPKREPRRKPAPKAEPVGHGRVPLGPEARVPGKGRPAREAKAGATSRKAHGPVPHGDPGPAAAEAGKAERPAGPVPHGDPGPERETPEETAEPRGGHREGPADAGWRPVWARGRAAARHWAARARLAVEHYVLARKREERLMELGVRVRQLAEGDALDTAPDDAGLRVRLGQVEQVEAAIRANRERDADLRAAAPDGAD